MNVRDDQDKLGFFVGDEVLIYRTPNSEICVEVLLHDEGLWLTQDRLSQLFGVERSVITKHLRNIFREGELDKEAVCAKFAHTAQDGKTYQTNFYSLDAIISVGYRVNSRNATLFRIWATRVLREYLQKGYVMNDERLKNPEYAFGADYFEEQLARIRDIRSSERRFYQKITDIYAQCSADYDKNSEVTRTFYATVQNKLHFAITGRTAAEIICDRANRNVPFMGLTSWKNGPEGMIREEDVLVAKNYLSESELDGLGRLVTAYLEFAELQARRGVLMTMEDWVRKLDDFLRVSDYGILRDAGSRTAAQAKQRALGEYEIYHANVLEGFQSDFDYFLLEGAEE